MTGRQRLFMPGDRVRIRTSAGGCYHGRTGSVTGLEDGLFRGLPPERYHDAEWWRVSMDEPADNGGVEVRSEIFLPRELYEE